MGVTLGEQGDAVATDPGTYQVKAKIKDGFWWRIVDPETRVPSFTTDDQIVSFTISGEKPGPGPAPDPGPGPGPGPQPRPVPRTGDDGGAPGWLAFAGSLVLAASLGMRRRRAHRG